MTGRCPRHDTELVADPFVMPGTEWAGTWMLCPLAVPGEADEWCDYGALVESDALRHADPWMTAAN